MWREGGEDEGSGLKVEGTKRGGEREGGEKVRERGGMRAVRGG